MFAEEADDLAADLEGGSVGVDVDAVEAVEVEHHVVIADVVSLNTACDGRR